MILVFQLIIMSHYEILHLNSKSAEIRCNIKRIKDEWNVIYYYWESWIYLIKIVYFFSISYSYLTNEKRSIMVPLIEIDINRLLHWLIPFFYGIESLFSTYAWRSFFANNLLKSTARHFPNYVMELPNGRATNA